jgi:hypothetical protein
MGERAREITGLLFRKTKSEARTVHPLLNGVIKYLSSKSPRRCARDELSRRVFMKTISHVFAFVWLLAITLSAHAHHSAVVFDFDKSISVTGTVTRLLWRSPHVAINLELVNEAGETEIWKLESYAINSLVGRGWKKTDVKKGEVITAQVNPLKSGKPGGVLQWVTLADGRVLPIHKDSPNGNKAVKVDVSTQSTIYVSTESAEDLAVRRKAALEREKKWRPATLPLINNVGGPGALDPEALIKKRSAAPFDMTGVWEFRVEDERSAKPGVNPWDFYPIPKLMPKAQATLDEYRAVIAQGKRGMDPHARCYPPGQPALMTRFGAFMAIQLPTAVYIVHRFNNSFRTIFLDGRGHVNEDIRQETYNGDAIGRWDGDSLKVDLVGFGSPEHWIMDGIQVSEQFRMTEHIEMLNEGNTLMIEMIFVDPENWVGEWKHTKFYDRLLNMDIEEATCIAELDNSALPGL